MSEKIKKALQFFEEEDTFREDNEDCYFEEREFHLTAIECMKAELERTQNDIFTYNQLKDMEGKPMWLEILETPNSWGYNSQYIIVQKVTDGFVQVIGGNIYNWFTPFKDANFYKQKPKEKEDE